MAAVGEKAKRGENGDSCKRAGDSLIARCPEHDKASDDTLVCGKRLEK